MPNSLFDNSETGLSVSVDRDEEGLSLHFFTKKKEEEEEEFKRKTSLHSYPCGIF